MTLRPKYNKDNIFWQIIQKKVPCNEIVNSKYSLSFYDIRPDAKIHALVIPKNPYVDFHDFFSNADAEEINDFFDNTLKCIEILKLKHSGFRIINNNGKDARQEVPHFHWHVLGGEDLSIK